MIKHPLVNARLLGVLAGLRHMDLLVIADAGLPCPSGVEELDLSLTAGTPSLPDVLDPVIRTGIFEAATVATETPTSYLDAVFEPLLDGLEVRTITHGELKELTCSARLLVRTGEHTAYANVVLVAGVSF